MTQRITFFATLLLMLILLLVGIILSTHLWLPRMAGIWLPKNVSVTAEGGAHWRDGALRLPDLRFHIRHCQPAFVSGIAISWQNGRWQLSAEDMSLDMACLGCFSQDKHQSSLTLSEWQKRLPAVAVNIKRFRLTPYQRYSGMLHISLDSQRQKIDYQGENIRISGQLQGRKLQLNHVMIKTDSLPQPFSLQGVITLDERIDAPPVAGTLFSDIRLLDTPQLMRVTLAWQQCQGSLLVSEAGKTVTLLNLPWEIGQDHFAVKHGTWQWPYGPQPVGGNISLTLNEWQQGLTGSQINARMNLLTSGRGGKGNQVLSIGPGPLPARGKRLPFQLTGIAKLATLQFYNSIAGEISGPLLDPELRLKPGALLRMRGRLLSTLEVDEARWPLAGIRLSRKGVNGRLQAILSAHDNKKGHFRLHLDGHAVDFLPDKGKWHWRYWGTGSVLPLAAKWSITGHGSWSDHLLTLKNLSASFDQLRHGMLKISAPQLSLTTPLRWQRSTTVPLFKGDFRLITRETRRNSAVVVPATSTELQLTGTSPDAFTFKSRVRAGDVGTLRANGRWDGERLRGRAWWPRQPLAAFQSLISPGLKLSLESGWLQAQVAFSATATQGLLAGGHWRITDGCLRMPDNAARGIAFSLPFRFDARQWYLGAQVPATLRIARIDNQFPLQDLTANLQGYYPWSEKQPLVLSNIGLRLLAGNLRLDRLTLPQRQAALLRLHNISLSELVTALKPKQLAMSGRVNGTLPLWLNTGEWVIEGGRLINDGNVTLRLDQQLVDALASEGMATATAIDWLRYLEISDLKATISLSQTGEVTLRAGIRGDNGRRKQHQPVMLNYQHQENLYQLWRSLRFSENLYTLLEKNMVLPLRKEEGEE